MRHSTAFHELGKLLVFVNAGRIAVVPSELIELLGRLSPERASSAVAAERYLKRFRYRPGNDDVDKFNHVAEKLFERFPLLPRDAAYALLREHSDRFGQNILFADIRRVADSRWGALAQ